MFDLPELVNVGGSGGVAGIGGAGSGPGGAGGGPPGGTANTGGGGVGGDGCPSGQKLCGGDCVDESPDNGCGAESCEPCATPERAQVSCNGDTGECRVDSCEVGYADCNGDTVGVAGAIDGDGCEYSFGTIVDADTSAPLDVRFEIITLDGDRADWSDVPAHALAETCRPLQPDGGDCRFDVTPPILAQNELPLPDDLIAYFRVAWDRNFLYVLTEAFDNHISALGDTTGIPGFNCQGGDSGFSVVCEDAFSVFIDGLADRQYGGDDAWVFLGLDSKFHAPAQEQPQASDVDVVASQHAPRCYRTEAQFAWSYVVGTNQAIPGKFPPSNDQIYGFDVSVSDVDPAASDPTLLQRQSHVFWKNPGDEYRFTTKHYGSIRLAGEQFEDAGATPP